MTPRLVFGALHYRELKPDGERAVLTMDFVIVFWLGGVRHHFVIPKGTITNWASVPWWLRWLLPRERFGRKGPLVHDYLYGLVGFPRFLADAIFRALMAADHIPWHRRVAAFYGVRLGGWAYYQRGTTSP